MTRLELENDEQVGADVVVHETDTLMREGLMIDCRNLTEKADLHQQRTKIIEREQSLKRDPGLMVDSNTGVQTQGLEANQDLADRFMVKVSIRETGSGIISEGKKTGNFQRAGSVERSEHVAIVQKMMMNIKNENGTVQSHRLSM